MSQVIMELCSWVKFGDSREIVTDAESFISDYTIVISGGERMAKYKEHRFDGRRFRRWLEGAFQGEVYHPPQSSLLIYTMLKESVDKPHEAFESEFYQGVDLHLTLCRSCEEQTSKIREWLYRK